MSYYLRQVPNGQTQIWSITDQDATLLGVTNPQNGPGSYFKANNGETIWNAIKRQATGWFGPDGESPFIETVLEPGQYYPRIVRPTAPHFHDPIGWSPSIGEEEQGIAIARSQLSILVRRLGDICQTIHPEGRNLSAYGNETRNLLILTCAEVESQWRGILAANGVLKERLTTNDYVGLQSAMQLKSYTVRFSSFPWLDPVSPFVRWGAGGSPTKEIPWFNSYNSVKHDREKMMQRASLNEVLSAVAAAAIMLVAQYGLPGGLGQRSELRDFFHISATPEWEFKDVYMHPYGVREEWEKVKYSF